MLAVGENPRSKIEQYSREFLSDFVRLLRSSHGEKQINANRFYQEYIANKEHIHMTATRWASLSELVRYLGSVGTVKVEETEKDGLCISYIDNSPDAIERREYLKKRADAEVDEDERASRLLNKQIDAAKKTAPTTEDDNTEKHELKREEGAKLSLTTSKPVLSMKKAAPVKKTNVFAAKASKVEKPKKSVPKANGASVLERIMIQDQQRRR